jgi:hypothetical protein
VSVPALDASVSDIRNLDSKVDSLLNILLARASLQRLLLAAGARCVTLGVVSKSGSSRPAKMAREGQTLSKLRR